jgi:flagellar protein FliS
MFSSYSDRTANAYKRISVETSMNAIDQHKLAALLFEGVLSSIAVARGAMARGDVLTKVNAVTKAIRILEEGLSTALDRVDGGELAANLSDLYAYCVRQLTLANVRNDDALMAEVSDLIQPIAKGWNEMRQLGSFQPSISVSM